MSDGNDGYPAHWPTWVVEILKELECIETEANAEMDDWCGLSGPKWVQTIGTEIAKILNPTVQFRNANMPGPKLLGALLGHQQWLFEDEHGLPKQLEGAAHAAEMREVLLREKLKPEVYKLMVKERKKATAEWTQRLRKAEQIARQKTTIIEKAKRVVTRQPLSEQAEFFTAYGKALATGLFDDAGTLIVGGLPSTTHIYFLLLVNWRNIRSFRTVTGLHAWLCRCLGETQVGCLDRVKTICKRYRIKLAPRGRPRR